MSTFQAFQVEKNDDGFARAIIERHVDELPEGDVLIDVQYSSLNYKDALSATGNPGVTRNFPHTPGIDAAGTVIESSATALIASGWMQGVADGYLDEKYLEPGLKAFRAVVESK